MDQIYRVKFIYLNQHDKENEEHDFNDIFDAIRVARFSNIGTDRTYVPSFTSTRFMELFPTLLKHGFVYTGRNNNVMVFLLKVNPDTQTESPIMPDGGEAIATPFSATESTVHKSEPGAGNYN